MERIGNRWIGARCPPARQQATRAGRGRCSPIFPGLAPRTWTPNRIVERQRLDAAAVSLDGWRHRRVTSGSVPAADTPRGSGWPLPWGIGAAFALPDLPRRIGTKGRSKAVFRLAPVIFPRETSLADVPDALTRRNRNLSPSACSSYGPRQGIGKPALRLGAKSPGSRVPPGPVARAFRFRLTTRA